MTREHKENQRRLANSLFYNKDNHYFKSIRNIFNNASNTLKERIYLNLKLENRYLLQSRVMDIIRAQHLESETSVKLWYTINFDGIPKYKFEIRGKNDYFKGSMQI